MCVHRLSIVVLLALTACAAPLTPNATSPIPTPTLSPPTPTGTPTPTPASTPKPTLTPTRIPHPTLFNSPLPAPAPKTPDLSVADPPPRPFDYTIVNPTPPHRVPNALRTFWVADADGERRPVTARLRVQTDRAALWVEEGVWHDVRKLTAAAEFFETQIYSTTRAVFGSEWMPGVDNDPRIHILHVGDLGENVAGYTSAADEFPRTVYPYSNEAELIVVSLSTVEVGSPAYYALLARQFQRLVQWYNDRNEERWLKEGLAELAVWVNGLDAGDVWQAYLENPDTSLTVWDDETAAHRGAAFLFTLYFHERFGDTATRALTEMPLNGAAGFDAVLARLDGRLTFEELFADWLTAVYLDGETSDSLYGYATLDLERPVLAANYRTYPVTLEGSVRQFGADYIRLRGDADLQVHFTGTITVPLLPARPRSGQHVWWSNRADQSLTTLTRALDLTGLSSATLTYWAWYDLEPGYDYVVVQASTDGGTTWQTLTTPSGTDDDPHGNNPGWGYTGRSGDPPRWIRETVDLSPYAGRQVLVRFACLTDEAITGPGFMLDDIAVPEIGYADDVEHGEGEWEAAGFVRTSYSIPQRYLVLLIGLDGKVTIKRLPLEENQTGEWTVPLASRGWHEAVLILSGLAPLTAEPARYQLVIE